jgi:hypothetical protein
MIVIHCSRGRPLVVLLLAVCTSCSSNSSTESTRSSRRQLGRDVQLDQYVPDPQSVNVCASLKAAINRRSLALLHQPAGLPLPLSAYKVYVNEDQPKMLALINLEEELYGIWRIPNGTGLCQLTMRLLENPRGSTEVGHYMRTHDLDSSSTPLYDGEFQSLASNEEVGYLDSLFAVRDELGLLSSPVATTRKLVPMIGVNVSSQKGAAELFSKLQGRLDSVYGELPRFAQRGIAEALNPTAH